MLVAKQVGRFGADPLQQSTPTPDAPDVDVERACKPLFRHAFGNRRHDHFVFLDDRQAIDAFVVREGFIIGRNQADDRVDSLLL